MEPLHNFETIALPHAKDLFRMASSLLRNSSEAEDAVQECLLQAWNCFGRFEPGTNCRAWLFKILFHVVSHQRRKWQRMWLAEDPQMLEDTLAARPEISDELTDEDLLAAFRKVPQRYAEVVMLADVQEFTYKEIQETLGIPIGTVMSRLNRGRHYLRTELAALCASLHGAQRERRTLTAHRRNIFSPTRHY
jgi:RNA polymerase sigma-70 factor (ECF subfamily)